MVTYAKLTSTFEKNKYYKEYIDFDLYFWSSRDIVINSLSSSD